MKQATTLNIAVFALSREIKKDRFFSLSLETVLKCTNSINHLDGSCIPQSAFASIPMPLGLS